VGRQSYRFSDHNFEDNARDGHGDGQPIRYKDIAPWYDYTERFAGVVVRQKIGLYYLMDNSYPYGFELCRKSVKRLENIIINHESSP
jgi:choline dehydrogenase-like flavoprotein